MMAAVKIGHGIDERLLGDPRPAVVACQQTDDGGEIALGPDVAVGRILHDRVAADDVAVAVFLADRPQRRPGADIVPTHFRRHDVGALGMFHDRVVDGHRFEHIERLFFEAKKIEIMDAAGD